METKATIVDYGMGNLYSVANAVRKCGFDPIATSDPDDVSASRILIIPGVGAFGDGMAELRDRNLVESIRSYSASGKSLMGICLGMQLLFDRSTEFGEHEGLKIVPGVVTEIPAVGPDGTQHQIPHVGWNELRYPEEGRSSSWKRTILDGIELGGSVYFVHSYYGTCRNSGDSLASSIYNGLVLSAVVQHGNTYGCQFHPEKSGPVGLKILKNFLTMAAGS